MIAKANMPTTWYNYLYMFPDDTVFYVGKGKNGRIDEHEKEAEEGCTCERCKTIRAIWKCGKPVKKRIVFETLIEDEALENERRLIIQYASEYLVNTVHNITYAIFEKTAKGREARQLIKYQEAEEESHSLKTTEEPANPNRVVRKAAKSLALYETLVIAELGSSAFELLNPSQVAAELGTYAIQLGDLVRQGWLAPVPGKDVGNAHQYYRWRVEFVKRYRKTYNRSKKGQSKQ